jgi:nucleoside-diphosphate-sugar epimerase
MNRQRILVTGGSGFIGSHLCEYLVRAGCEVRRLTRHPAQSQTDNVTDIVGDIRDVDIWDEQVREVDVVVHLAAQTSTYVANDDPLGDRAINVEPFLRLLETCRRSSRKPFIVLASTVTVVGVTDRTPVDEQSTCAPVTVYDAHKLMVEQYLETYCRLGYARGTTLRLANVYGPGRSGNTQDRGILNSMVRRAMAGLPLTVYGTGEFLRDYIYIDDVGRAFAAAIDCPSETNGKHWIIASGQSHTIKEAFQMISEEAASRTGIRVDVESVAPSYELSPIEARNFVANIAAFSSVTGWRPSVTLAEGIDLTLGAQASPPAREPKTPIAERGHLATER